MISTREFVIDDHKEAVALWRLLDGIEVAEGDSENEIANYLSRNPGLSRVADRQLRHFASCYPRQRRPSPSASLGRSRRPDAVGTLAHEQERAPPPFAGLAVSGRRLPVETPTGWS